LPFRLSRNTLAVQEIVKTTLEARHGEVVSGGFLVETMGGARLFARRRAEFEGDDKQEYENPQHHDQRDAALAKRRSV
jgi:hypothetical protein